MKHQLIFKVAFLFFLFVTLSWSETITVITRENAIRESPKFFSPIKAYVKYGDILNLIDKERDWYRVKFRNIIGYIHSTAVEKRTVSTFGDYTTPMTTAEGEITLAGKGFNPQVEKAYKSKYPQMRYDLVDRIEKYNISERELIIFINEGGLFEPK